MFRISKHGNWTPHWSRCTRSQPAFKYLILCGRTQAPRHFRLHEGRHKIMYLPRVTALQPWASSKEPSMQDTMRDSKSLYVGSPIPLVSITNSSTHSAPLATVYSIFCLVLYIHNTLKANQELGSWNRTSLRWGVVNPFCSSPRVGSSKEWKPVVMRWPERVLSTPEDQHFLNIFPNETAAYFFITAPPI